MHSEIKFLQAEKRLWEPHVEKCRYDNYTLGSSEKLSNNIRWTLVLKIKSVLSIAPICNAITVITSRKFGVRAGLRQVSFPVWVIWASYFLCSASWLWPTFSAAEFSDFFLVKTIIFHDISGYSWMSKREVKTLICMLNCSGEPPTNGLLSPREMHRQPLPETTPLPASLRTSNQTNPTTTKPTIAETDLRSVIHAPAKAPSAAQLFKNRNKK